MDIQDKAKILVSLCLDKVYISYAKLHTMKVPGWYISISDFYS